LAIVALGIVALILSRGRENKFLKKNLSGLGFATELANELNAEMTRCGIPVAALINRDTLSIWLGKKEHHKEEGDLISELAIFIVCNMDNVFLKTKRLQAKYLLIDPADLAETILQSLRPEFLEFSSYRTLDEAKEDTSN
jgi:hypothetical protein